MNKLELKKVSLEFRTLASQMLKIDSETEVNFIQIFYSYINKTPILKNYIDSCIEKEYNIEVVFREKENWKALSLPSDTKEIIGLVYQILSYLIENPNRLIGLCFYYTTGDTYSERIQSFMRKTIEPFVNAIKNYLELELVSNNEELNIEIKDNRKTLFLSYCQYDSSIANMVEAIITKRLGDKAKFSRDIRDVKYRESFRKFMETIGDHNFAILIVSDKYLKSLVCMKS